LFSWIECEAGRYPGFLRRHGIVPGGVSVGPASRDTGGAHSGALFFPLSHSQRFRFQRRSHPKLVLAFQPHATREATL
jgi:hypothetical protein